MRARCNGNELRGAIYAFPLAANRPVIDQSHIQYVAFSIPFVNEIDQRGAELAVGES